MNDSELDPVVGRALDELRRLPPVAPEAISRVVAAAAAARVTPADAPLMQPPRERSFSRWLTVGAIAAGLVGVAAIGATRMRERAIAPESAAPSAAAAPVVVPRSEKIRAVSSGDPDAAPLPHQFVFQSTAAHRISVVGDFNAWNPADAPMTRDPNTNLWSITLPITPGRHVYGFMIDDSVFALDPQEPTTRDPDLGTNGSVIIVGKP